MEAPTLPSLVAPEPAPVMHTHSCPQLTSKTAPPPPPPLSQAAETVRTYITRAGSSAADAAAKAALMQEVGAMDPTDWYADAAEKQAATAAIVASLVAHGGATPTGAADGAARPLA